MKRKNNHYISNIDTLPKKLKYDNNDYDNIIIPHSRKRKYNMESLLKVCNKFKRFKLDYSIDEEFDNVIDNFNDCDMGISNLSKKNDQLYDINPYFIDFY